jgi:hypothetical protein
MGNMRIINFLQILCFFYSEEKFLMMQKIVEICLLMLMCFLVSLSCSSLVVLLGGGEGKEERRIYSFIHRLRGWQLAPEIKSIAWDANSSRKNHDLFDVEPS